jgi:4-aminobutyrate aminotransferase / (S)-3-amino-2-methylpropionate transaminase / 5-aminovalerate transaminase
VLDAMKEDRLAERGAKIGERIRARFQKWADRFPQVGDVRGLGGMIAIELVTDRTTKAPAKELTGKLLAESLKRGVILLSAGTLGNVVRVLVPLTVEDAVLDEGLDAMERAFEVVVG